VPPDSLLPENFASQKISLSFSAYIKQVSCFLGLLALIGKIVSDPERTFQALHGCGQTDLYMSSIYQLWRFENALEPVQLLKWFDRLPLYRKVGYTTGDLNIPRHRWY